MEKIKLIHTDIEIAPLIFGGNVFGWTVDEKQAFKLLDEFFERGFNCIDTADSYSAWVPGNKGGESETIIGNWMKERGNRSQLVISTKVGDRISADKKGLSKKYILSAAEASLKRLQIGHIDLYQTHKDDPSTPIEETLQAYQQLMDDGKIGYIGVSNLSFERIEESLEISREKNLPGYQTLQPKYNLYDREFETKYADLVLKNNMSVITYSSLASGFLTGKYHSEKDFSKSVRGKGMEKYLNKKGEALLKVLEELSGKYNSSPAAISLAWLIKNPLVTAPIASATNKKQLDEIMQAVELKLSQEDMEKLNATGRQQQ
ncbi:aldo/keto reductase [Hanamia caeni]|jgi:aryl-alcohol dehydrogenase-like predicted oxidoreductase|uniref:Aldo/keto reductase n=1 Tax=Hanamia caeni TaxID=2294116 RepID=A0A3M9N6J0_9BACT|nr:aldo/keto reductase [Hanamia caeni]RNI33420.1 aldo/keto reductase [Hanamia caeni]